MVDEVVDPEGSCIHKWVEEEEEIGEEEEEVEEVDSYNEGEGMVVEEVDGMVDLLQWIDYLVEDHLENQEGILDGIQMMLLYHLLL